MKKKIEKTKSIGDWFYDIFGLSISNDFKENGNPGYTEDRIRENTRLNTSFLFLLVVSSIICTLGLLQGSAAAIIGGMIISPIVWPLMKVSFGISYEKISYIRHAIFLLILSIIIGIASSTIITMISPLKVINSEILARTNPNVIDIIIAIAGGFIAAIGISRPRISETLSGVAIATSLMPPLCVGGIGIALMDWKIFSSGVFLFLENAIAIIFVTTVMFIVLLKPANRSVEIRKRGLLLISSLLLAISIPSIIMLLDYSTELKTYAKIQEKIDSDFASISPSIRTSPAKIEILPNNEMDISLEVLMPEEISISYLEQEKIKDDLESVTEKKVNLEILLQRTIGTVKEEDMQNEKDKKIAQAILSESIKVIDPSLSINSFSLENSSPRRLKTVLSGESGVIFTEEDRENIENLISRSIGETDLDIEIIERKTLLAKPLLEEISIKKRAMQIINATDKEGGQIQGLTVKKNVNQTEDNGTDYSIIVDLRVSEGYEPDEKILGLIKAQLENEFGKTFSINIFIDETKSISL